MPHGTRGLQVGLVVSCGVLSDWHVGVEVVEGVLCSSDRVHIPVVLALVTRVGDLVAVCILSPLWEWLGYEGLIGVLFALSLELGPQRWWD